MRISCNREQLAAAFQLAASVAQQRSPKEVLQNVKIDATGDRVTLMATDMETGIRIDQKILKYDGRPFTAREIVKQIKKEKNSV